MKHIFIINPYAGTFDYSERIRNILKRKANFEYLVFDTEYKGHEKDLTERMCNIFGDEYIRFYSCGGSGTFVNIVNGIQDFEKTEVAYFPCGLSYDFLKCFGHDQVHFHNMNKLIEGDPMYVDMVDLGDHMAVNAFSVGIDAGVALDIDAFRMFSYINPQITYSLAAVKSLLLGRGRQYEIEIDGKNYDGKYLLIYIGNGVCYGSSYYPSMDADPRDGMLDIILVNSMNVLGFANKLKYFAGGNFEEISKFATIIKGKEFHIKSNTRNGMMCSTDGEVFQKKEIEGKMCQGKLRMIVPKGVTVKNVKDAKEAFNCGRKK